MYNPTEKITKKLYDYQIRAMGQIFDKLDAVPNDFNLLFQLPTGGGKTVIFSEIARRFIKETGKKVLILTHRVELCSQTSRMLMEFGVENKVINSDVKTIPDQENHTCFVAMVETLNNRINQDGLVLKDVGLVIIDEAHYNSFTKLFKNFLDCNILGVTATPLSSNITLPMNGFYGDLIVGESIPNLVKDGYLAQATTYSYNVSLTSLRVGINGDYTVGSSEKLYSAIAMQDKLLGAYQEQCLGKKTLIFNNGINTSKHVYETFVNAGYDIRHLDNTHTSKERREILDWFKNKPDAILTSVSILTTGFDEPSVNAIILNRATRSLTLYYQMIGRGSRILGNKKEFTIIDLGNNLARFGLWNTELDWNDIYKNPELHLDNIRTDSEIERHQIYKMPDELKKRFANSGEMKFDMDLAYSTALDKGERPKVAIEKCLEYHVTLCLENSTELEEAHELQAILIEDIRFQLRRFSYCICKSTKNYLDWMETDYNEKMRRSINTEYRLIALKQMV
ncbi:MAG: superfamily II DNA or RNA helicase [Flavobacteriales bacterium]